jgi:hypothetical protein
MSIELDLIDAFDSEVRRAYGIESALCGLSNETGRSLSLRGVLTLQNDHIESLTELKKKLHELFHKSGKVADPPEDDDEDEDGAAA